jgi:hypothetical protein
MYSYKITELSKKFSEKYSEITLIESKLLKLLSEERNHNKAVELMSLYEEEPDVKILLIQWLVKIFSQQTAAFQNSSLLQECQKNITKYRETNDLYYLLGLPLELIEMPSSKMTLINLFALLQKRETFISTEGIRPWRQNLRKSLETKRIKPYFESLWKSSFWSSIKEPFPLTDVREKIYLLRNNSILWSTLIYDPWIFPAACLNGDIEVVILILSSLNEAQISELLSRQEHEALTVASTKGQLEVVKILLAKDAPKKIKEVMASTNYRPIRNAANENHFDVVFSLFPEEIPFSSWLFSSNYYTHNNILENACQYGHIDSIKLFLLAYGEGRFLLRNYWKYIMEALKSKHINVIHAFKSLLSYSFIIVYYG